ncbi:MAG: hypothetical protein HC932_05590, partial [Thermales bacterium]|nr:hypothetical protein [Thermales bacterium]
FLFFLILSSSSVMMGSHIRAANIFADKVAGTSRTYNIKLTVFTDFSQVEGNGNDIDMTTAKIGFGNRKTVNFCTSCFKTSSS